MKTIRSLFNLTFWAILISACVPITDDPVNPARIAEIQNDTSSNQNNVNAILPVDTIDCFNILIDASKDGGVWWFPQWESFNSDLDHQGLLFAQTLRKAGYQVDELGRDQQITDDILKKYNIIIRADGFESYAQGELDAYKKALDRGITLLLLSDHKKNDPVDELEDMLNVHFVDAVSGTITKFEDYPIVAGVTSLDYIAGSYIANTDNPDIIPIAWLSVDSSEVAVMGLLNHPKSRIFLLGDTNTLELIPEPLTQNLIDWIAEGCGKN